VKESTAPAIRIKGGAAVRGDSSAVWSPGLQKAPGQWSSKQTTQMVRLLRIRPSWKLCHNEERSLGESPRTCSLAHPASATRRFVAHGVSAGSTGACAAEPRERTRREQESNAQTSHLRQRGDWSALVAVLTAKPAPTSCRRDSCIRVRC